MGLLVVEGLLSIPSLVLAGCCRCCLLLGVYEVLSNHLVTASASSSFLASLVYSSPKSPLEKAGGLEESLLDFPWSWRVSESRLPSCHEGSRENVSH